MRKAMFSAVVALAIAGVAVALPSGAGTLYVDSLVSGQGHVIKYIDLDASFNIVNSGTLTTVADSTLPAGNQSGTYGYSQASAITPDMGGVYHSATLGMLANNNIVTISGTSGAVASITPTNNAGYFDHKGTAVGSGFTGGAPGYLTEGWIAWGPWDTRMWTGAGLTTETVLPQMTQDVAWFGVGHLVSSDLTTTAYTVNGHQVRGIAVKVTTDAPGWIDAEYAAADGTFFYVKGQAGIAIGREGQGADYTVPTTVGDTNGNGIADIFVQGSGGTIYRAEDLNGNGTWADAGETTAQGVTGMGGTWDNTPCSLQLITNGGSSALVSYYGGTVKFYAIDSVTGNVTGSATTIATGFAPAGAFASELTFSALGASVPPTPEPEPATMMLVGTGVLGLAGVIRRRLIS